jgi:basic membrane protein A and related proteins
MEKHMLTRRALLGATAMAGAAAFGKAGLTTAAAAEPINIGVLIPGSVQDRGFMESANTGLKAVQARLADKAKIQLIENINYADMEQVFVTLASKNPYVAAVSGASQAAMLRVAKRFPAVKFGLVGGAKLSGEETNVSQFDVRQAEIGYVSGAAAALLSKTGVISYIGGLEIPGIVNTGKEFGNGARSVRPDIKYIQTFTGNFDDVAKAKEAGIAAAAQGADIHYHILNQGLRGLEQAARETNTRVFGGITSRCGTDPVYIGYSVTNIGHLLGIIIEEYASGTWKPGSRFFGLTAGPQASDVSICDGATPAIQAKLDEIKKDIVAGKIKTLEG